MRQYCFRLAICSFFTGLKSHHWNNQGVFTQEFQLSKAMTRGGQTRTTVNTLIPTPKFLISWYIPPSPSPPPPPHASHPPPYCPPSPPKKIPTAGRDQYIAFQDFSMTRFNTQAGCKESHFYSLPSGQAEASIYWPKCHFKKPQKLFEKQN